MKLVSGVALLAASVILLAWGYQASQSTSSDFSRLFRGGPSDRTLWLVIGGAVAGVAGLLLLVLPKRQTV